MALAIDVEEHDPIPDDDTIEAAIAERKRQDDTVVDLFRGLLLPEVFEEQAVRDFLDRYGPLESETIDELLTFAVEVGGAEQHIATVLDGLRPALEGEA